MIASAQTTEFKRPKITGIAHIGIFTDDLSNVYLRDGTRVELMTKTAVSGTPSPSTYGLPLRYDGDMEHLLYK